VPPHQVHVDGGVANVLKEIAAAHELGDQGHLAGWHPETVFNPRNEQKRLLD